LEVHLGRGNPLDGRRCVIERWAGDILMKICLDPRAMGVWRPSVAIKIGGRCESIANGVFEDWSAVCTNNFCVRAEYRLR